MLVNLLSVDPAIVAAYIVSIAIPGVTSLLSRRHWDGFVMGLITVVLSLLNGIFSTIAAESHGISWKLALSTAISSYIIATLARGGLWRGTNADSALLDFPKAHPAPAGDAGEADLFLVVIVLLVLFAIFGGIFIGKVLWFLLIVALVVFLFNTITSRGPRS